MDNDRQDYDMFAATCTTRQALTRIADKKWTMLVLMALAEQSYYFGELRRKVECIFAKNAHANLRKLEADGLVARDVQATKVVKIGIVLRL